MAPPVRDVSVADYAQWVGVTSQRVYQWIQEGMPHRRRGTRTTRIVPREAHAWHLLRAKEQATPTDGPTRPRDRKENAEAELKELQVQELRKALIPIDEFETFVDAFVGGFAAVAAGRLQRFEREMVDATTPAMARVLTERIHAALMSGAQEYGNELEAEAHDLLAADEASAA